MCVCMCTYMCVYMCVCVYPQSGILSSHKNEIMSFAITWMDLEGMPSEII